MFFEGFEGFKKIKNTIKLDINQIYDLLMKYEKEIGTIQIVEGIEDTILINVDNRCLVDLKLQNGHIIIERRISEGDINEDNTSFEQGKDLDVAYTDRMIEQIYDLLNDYIDNNGNISEHVTSPKKILYMEESERLILAGTFSLGNVFTIKDENGKIIYEAKQGHISQSYQLKNLETRMEEFSLKYDKADSNQYMIIKPPFKKIDFSLDKNSTKTIFIGKENGNRIEVSADYTDNHFLVEENEIVIGAIDCLDPLVKNKYKIEINDLKREALLVIIAIMLDIYNFIHNNELGVQ